MLRDDIRSCCQFKPRLLLALPAPEMPDIKTPLFARELRGEDLKFVAESETGLEDRLRWAIRSISDEAGNRVFCDADIEWIGGDDGLPTPLIERAFWAARQVTGYTEENRRSFLPVSPNTTAPGSLTN